MPSTSDSLSVGPKLSEQKLAKQRSQKGNDDMEGGKRRSRPGSLRMSSSRPLVAENFMVRLKARSRVLCDSWRFCVLTTVLTLYALFGDDFRLWATPKRTDVLFNVITLLCIIIFTVEIVAASIGKEGYFLGFFFTLDTLSTVTLVVDLSWITNLMLCDTGGSGQAYETGRAGKAGARASRTVRIIRLIRLAKLYKTFKLHMEQQDASRTGGQKRWRRTSMDNLGPGESEAEEDTRQPSDENLGPEKEPEETRVGKKLSDMTTRRVILLVLTMLCIMPLFSTSAWDRTDFRMSASIGLDTIYRRWREWCPLNVTETGVIPECLLALDVYNDPPRSSEARWWYEKELLSFLYVHHVGESLGNSWKLYWIGLSSLLLRQRSGDGASASFLGQLAQLGQTRYLGSDPQFLVPPARWDGMFADPQWMMQVAALPESVKTKLTSPWVEECEQAGGEFVGLPVSPRDDEEDEEESGAGTGQESCSVEGELRCSEYWYFFPSMKTIQEADHLDMAFVFDMRETTKMEACLSILQTIFICLAVGIGAMGFSNDANDLLLNPIERMVGKMEAIKDNPLEAMKLGDLEFRREEIELAKRKEQLATRSKLWRLVSRGPRKVREPMETVILEKTIIKLGGLLALGFGEAGAEIIGQNMKGCHSAVVNAMVPGQKVDAILGFCNIRDFSEVTEVLKEAVMLFVNQVGEIVHGCVDDYMGAPNKNIGDAFLLVWRLSGQKKARQTKLADMAVMSNLRIIASLHKSPVLAQYREHPGLQQRCPDFRVSMGFGLHCGWAIEGAIGSEFKIDASYLSPNVNVTSRLQAATAQFGVSILISHFMISICSQDLAGFTRMIDHITVKGSKQPVRLHTVDLDWIKLDVISRSHDPVVKTNRFKLRQIREVHKTAKWADDYKVWEAFGKDEDLIIMRSSFNKEFFQRFSMAYRNYEAGEWLVARDMLFTCAYLPKDNSGQLSGIVDRDDWPEDGPSVTLLNFMAKFDFIAPREWPGHRELTEK